MGPTKTPLIPWSTVWWKKLEALQKTVFEERKQYADIGYVKADLGITEEK